MSKPALRKVGRLLRVAGPLVVGLAAVVLIIAWLAGAFHSRIAPGEQQVAARRLAGEPVYMVDEIEKEYLEEAVGTLKSASRTAISAKILATIDELTVSAGDQVEAGQVLVRLAGSELEARRSQAEQSLAAAQASRAEAESGYQRAERLKRQDPGAIAQATIDEAKRRLQVAEAEQRRAEQSLTEAEVMLSYTAIKTPKAGRIVDRLAEPGDTARPGEPLLVLYDARALRLEAPVVEHRAVALREGQTLTVRIDALDREVQATVDEIVPQAEAPSRSFLVKVALPYSPDLYEGMFGRLLIPAGTRRYVCLASDALVQVGQLDFVDVVRDDETLTRRLVRIGRVGEAGRVEVLSGLAAGERVVLHSGVGSSAAGSSAAGSSAAGSPTTGDAR